jgi:uncharacterized membrane protein
MAFTLIRPAVLLAVAGAALPLSAARAETFEGRDICRCYVTSMSADGTAATGQLYGSYQTFYWTWQGGMQPLGRGTQRKLKTSAGTPAISADGKVVAATIIDVGQDHGTQGRWTAETGWQQLMPPRPADGAIVDRYDGSVFGMSRDGKTVTGLYWRNTGVGGLAHSSGGSSRIDDANADGSVLVGWDEHPQYGNRRAAVWVHGVKTVLEDSDWPSEAGAVNAAGTIIVGQAVDPATQINGAAMWTWNGSQWVKKSLGVLPGTQPGGMAYASALSDDGKTVVGTARRFFSPSNRGFIWTEDSGMVEAGKYFKDRGYNVGKKLEIQSVSTISADGQVMGVSGIEVATGATRSLAARRLTARR